MCRNLSYFNETICHVGERGFGLGNVPQKEKYLLRITIPFLVAVFLFKIEFWPISHFPVFVTKSTNQQFSTYRLALEYQDGSISFPLKGDYGRKVNSIVGIEVNRIKQVRKGGIVNLYEAIALLKMQYDQRPMEFYKLTENVRSVALVEQVRILKGDHYELAQTRKLFEVTAREFYDRIF